jgi:predicted PurR-regulated permease PerM
MLRMAKGERAVSAVLSVMLLIIIVFVLGIVLFNFVIGLVGNITESDSTQPFSLLIENVNINDTCMTIHVGNRLNHEVSVQTAYINDEPREILNLLGNGASIPANSTGTLYVKGPYVAGGLYNIKLIFNSGNSVISVARY